MSNLVRVYPAVVFLVALWLTGCAESPPTSDATPEPSPELAAKADALLREVLETGSPTIPGIAVAVFRDGRLVHAGAAGQSDLEAGTASTPDTRFRLYSTAKALTAAAAFRLAEQGVVDLDAPIGDVLTDLPDDKRSLTLRQLLAHRGGIRHYNQGEWLSVSTRACTDATEALGDFIDDPLVSPPGTETRYTSFGYVLVSAVLQAATGKTFDPLMRDTVFQPAGMAGISLEGLSHGEAPIAQFYLSPEEDGEAPQPTSTYDIDASCKFGGGGLVGSATDLAAFASALIRRELISQESLDVMTTQVTPAHPLGLYPPMGYGIFPEQRFPGFDGVPEETVRRAWWHGGSAAGGYAVLIGYPDEDVAVGIASNINAGGRLIGAAHRIASLWFEGPPPPPSAQQDATGS